MRLIVFTRAEAETRFVDGPHTCISIADSDQAPATLPDNPGRIGVLRLHFDDVLDSERQDRDIVAFDRETAQAILDFVMATKAKGIDTLVVHCNGGQCRSPGVAAAIDKIDTGDDEHWFSTRHPNSLVYRTLLDVHYNGIEGPDTKSAFGP